jgi:hypothetical protein
MRLGRAVAVLEKKHPKVAAFLEEQGEETLAVYELPSEHRPALRDQDNQDQYRQESAHLPLPMLPFHICLSLPGAAPELSRQAAQT